MCLLSEKRRKAKPSFALALWLVSGWLILMASGCSLMDPRRTPVRPVRDRDARVLRMEVTGYCPCGICCGWKRDWRGRAVVAYGPNKGQRKQVGVTASGTRARLGTVAADPRVLPFGTVVYVPGYGYGLVEDRGGDIKGHKLDLFFPSHRQALEWGRVQKDVKIWLPK